MSKGREQKPHIGIFGRRNNGKSTLINFMVGQQVAIVSETAGTTTDPVKKSVEITGFGPVIIVDTAGIDDVGDLGVLRIEKTMEAIKIIDLAILVIVDNDFNEIEKNLIGEFKRFKTPFFIVHNKSDILPINPQFKLKIEEKYSTEIVNLSAQRETDNSLLLKTIARLLPDESYKQASILGDLVSYGDIVLLITPIDVEAPAGRLILPQVQAIRDILDNDCVAVVLKEREVDAFLRKTGIQPKLAVTDSQIFLKASASVPKNIPLTSFSILLARLKGEFSYYLKGTPQIDKLKDGDQVLLLESCTHHVSCDDIGRIKIPRWILQFTGKKIEFDVVSGLDTLTRPIIDYSLVIQCGGCMITSKQLKNRLLPAIEAGVAVTNYGMAIAYLQGVYDRAIELFMTGEKETDYL
jgi:[FeFe] hydrogenase H-cluster maturation GTPase HydF